MPVVPLSDEEAEAIIQAADTDGDGRIDFQGGQRMYHKDCLSVYSVNIPVSLKQRTCLGPATGDTGVLRQEFETFYLIL